MKSDPLSRFRSYAGETSQLVDQLLDGGSVHGLRWSLPCSALDHSAREDVEDPLFGAHLSDRRRLGQLVEVVGVFF